MLTNILKQLQPHGKRKYHSTDKTKIGIKVEILTKKMISPDERHKGYMKN